MADILRIYDPTECDQQGVPLDWERCRACFGVGCGHIDEDGEYPCEVCGGHGSLRKAARFAKATRLVTANHKACAGTGNLVEVWPQADGSGNIGDDCHCVHRELRCEDCGHPMSDGTWEGSAVELEGDSWSKEVDLHPKTLGESLVYERQGFAVHYSPCDKGCRHGGPNDGLRWEFPRVPDKIHQGWVIGGLEITAGEHRKKSPEAALEASWRQVEVRTLGWPHDLRAKKLAVLCLRCWTARKHLTLATESHGS